MEKNPKTLGIERHPAKAVHFPPTGPKHPYKVTDGDDWKSVANKFSVDVNALINFNFQTTNPDEVN